MKEHKVVQQQGRFFFHYCQCNFDDQLSPNFHMLGCTPSVQVKILVFDNYQRCGVPLRATNSISFPC